MTKTEIKTEDHSIDLVKDVRVKTPSHIRCTCGWTEGPITNYMDLSKAGKEHSNQTGHVMRRHM